MDRLLLLPMPRRVVVGRGRFVPRRGGYIRLAGDGPQALLAAGRVVQAGVEEATGHRWGLVAGDAPPEKGVAVVTQLDASIEHPQGYRLHIHPGGVEIRAKEPVGVFYAAQTLRQISRQCPDALPEVRIEDWPDFPVRGYMQDISRDKVPTMATLFALVDQLAELKVNQLQLYTEHTFAYRQHPEVWAEASPMTGEQVMELDAYCRARFIELVPNQNCFGHMERWLKLPRYEPLAEKPDGFAFPWGTRIETGFSLNPTDARSIEFVEGLLDELLPCFVSRTINVGCDETFDIGLGRSRMEAEKRGKERVYLDFLLKIHEAVSRRGRRMMFWGDIIVHKPELIGELPRDVVALNWGYDADHPFEKETKAFASAGVPFYVCPGTSSWLSIGGRSGNALANLRSAAEHGLANGAAGYLITDWGDLGHLQYWPVSWLGMAAGAGYSWCLSANRDVSVTDAVDAHVFRDSAGVMGKATYDLGSVHEGIGPRMGMSTRLFWTLVGGADRTRLHEMITAEEYDEALRRVEGAVAPVDGARMARGDAQVIVDEVLNAAAMLRHACRRGRWLRDRSLEDGNGLAADLRRIIGEHRRLWLARNREGGLDDSTRRLEERLAEYLR